MTINSHEITRLILAFESYPCPSNKLQLEPLLRAPQLSQADRERIHLALDEPVWPL